MPLRTILSLIYILFALFISSSATADVLNSKEELLKYEIKLARKPQIYFMLNLEEKKIYIKARGIILKEIPVYDIRFWGDILRVQPYLMFKKSAFSTPMRDKINPEEIDKEENNNDEKKKFELKALELSDMPASYTLSLDENVFISVKPIHKSMVMRLFADAYSLNWYVAKPLYTVWNTIRNKPYTAIQLLLKKEDAQSLYWSFVEGGKIIIN